MSLFFEVNGCYSVCDPRRVPVVFSLLTAVTAAHVLAKGDSGIVGPIAEIPAAVLELVKFSSPLSAFYGLLAVVCGLMVSLPPALYSATSSSGRQRPFFLCFKHGMRPLTTELPLLPTPTLRTSPGSCLAWCAVRTSRLPVQRSVRARRARTHPHCAEAHDWCGPPDHERSDSCHSQGERTSPPDAAERGQVWHPLLLL